MPGLERLDDGTWRMTGSRRGGELGDELHDQALVRYLNAFDPAFTRAREVCEFEFIFYSGAAWISRPSAMLGRARVLCIFTTERTST